MEVEQVLIQVLSKSSSSMSFCKKKFLEIPSSLSLFSFDSLLL